MYFFSTHPIRWVWIPRGIWSLIWRPWRWGCGGRGPRPGSSSSLWPRNKWRAAQSPCSRSDDKKKKSRLSSHRARTSLFVCLCVDTFFRAQHFTTPVQLRESMMRLHFEAQGGNIKQQQCNNKFMVIKVIKSNGSVDTHFVTALVFGWLIPVLFWSHFLLNIVVTFNFLLTCDPRALFPSCVPPKPDFYSVLFCYRLSATHIWLKTIIFHLYN